MINAAIKVEGLGKKYIISHEKKEGYTALRDVIANKTKKLIKKNNSEFDEKEEFWALKDVAFEIQQGEAVGIIGRNGAGKSTLLKILSRITEPTTGRIEINGRIASLLEVGTGFHPELTGRENIYLNGAILGMSRVEIKKKFDEIVDFSGVDKFLDTPVKRYSSGMYVRLAFAVAAHLEPEILVIDEVLAVGDAEFQKKCLGKMDDVSKSGRTVLFVSHDLSAISTLTQKAIFLSNGKMVDFGPTMSVMQAYASNFTKNPIHVLKQIKDKPCVTRVELVTSEGGAIQGNGRPLEIKFEIDIPFATTGMALSLQIFNHLNQAILYNWIFDCETPVMREKGKHKISVNYESIRLYHGYYFLKVHLSETNTKSKFQQFDCCPFEVGMINKKEPEWGWTKNVCQYFDDAVWSFQGTQFIQSISKQQQ
jgi:lipopolysaccharide transport system ATP-binding protein